MTGPEFAAAHGNDASTWSPADIEAEFVFAEIDRLPVACWFCAAENPPNTTTCGFCNHHKDDGPQVSARPLTAA